MKSAGTFLLPALLTAILAGCKPGLLDTPAPPRVTVNPDRLSGRAAFEEVRNFVAIGPRDSGTPGAKRAAEYLAERLTALGIDPLIDEFEETTGSGTVTFRNVIGTIPGKHDRALILGSHYDTKSGISPTFSGANDSGSSTGLLLAIAKELREAAPLELEVLIVFFDGEECVDHYAPNDGLHGSRHLAKTLIRNRRIDKTRAMILLDMIGDRDLQITLPRNCSASLVKLALDSARELGVRHRFSLHRSHILDDHVPFREAGIESLNLIDFQYGSGPGKNDYWHTSADTLDKISPESLEIVGRVVIGMINRLMAE